MVARRNFLVLVGFCGGAVLLNLFGAHLTRFFVFPLYIDSISTIATAYFFGLVPALLVAFFTNIVMTLWFGTPIVFMTCHLMTAAGAWCVFRFLKGEGTRKNAEVKNPPIDLFLISGLLSALTNSVFGSIYSLVMYAGETEASITPFLMCIKYITGNMSLSIFWSGIVTNLADKTLSAMISYLLAVGVFKYHTDLRSPNGLRFKFFKEKSVRTVFSQRAEGDVSSGGGQIRVTNKYRDYFITLFLIFLAVFNIASCVILQNRYQKITGEAPRLDSSLYIMILASAILIAASFMIVYAKMIQTQKEKEIEDKKREWEQNLALNLHDGVLQNLVALNATLEANLKQEESKGEVQFIKNAISEIRLLCGILRLNDEVPFEEALNHTLDAFEKTYGFKTRLGIATDLSFLSSTEKEEILRIMYECLSNTARHSNAENIAVTFADDGKGKLYFTVRDDGKIGEKRSLDYARDDTGRLQRDDIARDYSHGIGLESIKSRAKNLGGEADFFRTESGWTVRVIFPKNPSAAR